MNKKSESRKLVTFQVPAHLVDLFDVAVTATGKSTTTIITDCLEIAMRSVVEGYLEEQEAARKQFVGLLEESGLPKLAGKPRVKKTS
jgi:hypothetical protein